MTVSLRRMEPHCDAQKRPSPPAADREATRRNFGLQPWLVSKVGSCSRDSLIGKMKIGPRAPAPKQKLLNMPWGWGNRNGRDFSSRKAPAGWLKEPAGGLDYKQKMWTRGHQNCCSVLNPGPPHGHTGCMDVLACRGLLAGGLSWAHTRNYTILGQSREWPS